MITGFSKEFTFKKASPVWEENKEKELNYSLIFRTKTEGNDELKISISANSRYQIFVNGAFYKAGPARAGHGFYRVDNYTLKDELSAKENIISIIVAGYNVNNFYLIDTPAFLCCEIEKGGEIIAATGDTGFRAVRYQNRLQKTPRYSFQRTFTEAYIYDAYYDLYLTDPSAEQVSVKLQPTEPKKFIERNSPYCNYTENKAEKIISKGILVPDKNRKMYDDRSVSDVGENFKGFKTNELETFPINELYAYYTQILETDTLAMESVSLGINCCSIYDMGKNMTGYIRLSLTAEHDTVIYAVFHETLSDKNCPAPGKGGVQNVVKWAIQGGRTYDFMSFEPYTFKYIQIISMYAPTLVTNVSVIEEAYPETKLSNLKAQKTPELQKIYDAAVNTFRQNSTDIFMDCPSRERAGWLCDSFFTSRVERELTGQSLIEHDFIENFLLPEKFNDIPEGMLPMCYPADFYDGNYIHNWAFWFVLELKEYLKRTNDEKMIENAKDRVYKLMEFSEKFENSDGLLENVGGWIFVEWSKANDFVKNVNYPSNMLYSLVLSTVGELYGDEKFTKKAEKVKEQVLKQSFNGEFFIDNAIRENGELKITDNISETCQYYAFFTGVAKKETFPELYNKLLEKFGPVREENDEYPEIHKANAFIGNYLRLEILFNDKKYDKLLSEIKSFFIPMAEITGTLWENMSSHASCCHGFASHVAYWLNRI